MSKDNMPSSGRALFEVQSFPTDIKVEPKSHMELHRVHKDDGTIIGVQVRKGEDKDEDTTLWGRIWALLQ